MSVVAFISSNGGSGCTVQSKRHAVTLATEFKKRVLLVDACSQCSITDSMTNKGNRAEYATLCGEAMALCKGESEFPVFKCKNGGGFYEGKAVYELKDRDVGELYLLCGNVDKIELQRRITIASESSAGSGAVDAFCVQDVIRNLIDRLELDYVIIDLGQDTRHSIAWSLLLASHAIVVTHSPINRQDPSLGLGPPIEAVMDMTSRFLRALCKTYPVTAKHMFVPPIVAEGRVASFNYLGEGDSGPSPKWMFDRAFCIKRDIARLDDFSPKQLVKIVNEAVTDQIHKTRQLISRQCSSFGSKIKGDERQIVFALLQNHKLLDLFQVTEQEIRCVAKFLEG